MKKKPKEHSIPLYTDYSTSPLVRFIYNNKEYYALVDTGSEVTLVDRKFAKENGLTLSVKEDTEHSFASLTSEFSEPYQHVTMTVDMWARLPKDYSKLTFSATLSDLTVVQSSFDKRSGYKIKVPVLFGSDTLTTIGAEIDFTTNTFSYDDISC